ncbi:hypothetical protein [Leptotrichia sp. OH3620_COT-345]|uniref:hypothetical protein n=1 Tax=Leptotrichia sp. OH3620_COT-345 TaxID=2491048 RepID=UPI0013157BF2|nr:hypothetical protein [Leptotrichia sp. OH3620_COT-345]
MKKIFKLLVIILILVSFNGCFLLDGYGYSSERSSGVCNAGSMSSAVRDNAYNSSACK